MDLYKQQLVSPFTVFQLFCVILWCLDSYWQVSAVDGEGPLASAQHVQSAAWLPA